MTTVAFMTQHDGENWMRQTPQSSGDWLGVRFVINGGEADADWLVAYDDVREMVSTDLPKSRRVLVVTEPPGLKAYRPGFINQFGVLLSPMPIPGFNGHFIQTDVGLSWWFGVDRSSDKSPFPCRFDFDQLQAMPYPEKQHKLSAVVSTNTHLPRHRKRLEFTLTLKERLGDRLELYGRGFRPIDDKADAILPYTHHLSIENNTEDNFFTEKLTDAYLGWALPLFSGCSNIAKFFPAGSLIDFDLDAPDAIESVVAALDQPIDARRLAAIGAARSAVLTEHNIFAKLTAILGAMDVPDDKRLSVPVYRYERFEPFSKRLRSRWRTIRKAIFPSRKPSLRKQKYIERAKLLGQTDRDPD